MSYGFGYLLEGMCAKGRGNANECKRCAEITTCKPGQLAVARLDMDAPKKPEPAPVKEKRERELFWQACESGNALGFLMAVLGVNRNSAEETLRRMCRTFPGLAADYGGSKRILRMNRPLTLTNRPPEPMPPPEPEPMPPPENPRTVRFRERMEQAALSGDPLAWLLENGAKNAVSARESIRQAKKRWPELFAPEPGPESETLTDDEISLADFLDEYATQEPPEEHDEETPVREAEAQQEPKQSLSELLSEWRELRRRLREIEEQMERVR